MCRNKESQAHEAIRIGKKQIPQCAVELAGRLVKRVAWPERRQAMAEVTLALLDGKARTAETVFGWGRSAVELGLQELRTGIVCIHDLSQRRKPKREEKHPHLLTDIRRILDPNSQAQSHLCTPWSYTHMTAKAVPAALLENGSLEAELPGVRTPSNILNRQGYRLRHVEKSRGQENAVDGRDLCECEARERGGGCRSRKRAREHRHQGGERDRPLFPRRSFARSAARRGGRSR